MNDKRLRIYGALIIDIYLLMFFYPKLYKSPATILLCIVASTIFSFLAWEAARFITLWAIRSFPGIDRKKRMWMLIFTGIPLTLLTTALNQVFRLSIGFFKHLTFIDFLFIEGINLIVTFVVISIYERRYYLQQWKILQQQAEEIRKINLNSQYKFLEQQIKPHFLFNSLNTLQSLININPRRAEEFVEEMSTVYRYLLRKNKTELTTLRDELKFLQSFVTMLNIRFEDALEIKVDTLPESGKYYLPPFVLQLLVENAIKHNIVSKQQKLLVTICSDGPEMIVVTNNLQKKHAENSEKTGLINLIERYRLLKLDHKLNIVEEHDHFKVSVPLAVSNAFAQTA